MDGGCENGPPNGINPRPVNPFIGAANPATGHERGCLLDPRIRGLIYPTRERERERERDWKYIEMVTWPRWSNDHDNGSNKGSTCVLAEKIWGWSRYKSV